VDAVYSLDNPRMPPSPDRHLILPFAASLSEPCQQALTRLDDAQSLPHLHQLLGRLSQATRLDGDEYALSMPHERLMAQALGWGDLPDGSLPWAALSAQGSGLPAAGKAWGLLSPCHWLMGRETLTLIDPDELQLGEPESKALLDVLRPWFEEEGWTLDYAAPTRWYATHPSLASLPTASLDRVIGRNPDVWMPSHPQARLIKRLQNEVQMLMYEHPLNAEREAAGQLTVNSFWLSGTGQLPADQAPASPPGQSLVTDLRAPLLASNLADWIAAWQTLDATLFKEACATLDLGQPLHLSLCGERSAVTLSPPPSLTFTQRLRGGLQQWLGRHRTLPSALLATL
jgi:hypothetical protein